METSGTTLKQLSSSLNSVITGARWNGPDSERFRSQWHNGMRLKLRSTGDVLAQYSRILNNQADEQVQASVASGLPAGPGDPLRVGPGDDGVANLSLDDVAAANSNPAYQTGNLLASLGSVFADNLLGKMIKAGLLREMPWSLLSARGGQLGQYFKGTQLLNGLSMAGRAAGVLSIIGGGAQFANGLMDGNTNQMLDGGITTVLGVGSFIPVVGPALPWRESSGPAWACCPTPWATTAPVRCSATAPSGLANKAPTWPKRRGAGCPVDRVECSRHLSLTRISTPRKQ